MKYTQGKYIITRKTAIAKEIYSFTIQCPEVAEAAQPGQFVHIRANGFTLRRPISICGIDKEKGTLRIVFEIRGEGTAEIAKLNEGDLIDMLAPLGHGFTLMPEAKKAVLIGGGIGTPPMLPLAEYYGGRATVISGFRNASAMILQEDFKKTGAETVLCTDDGSAGIHGFVTEPLKELAAKGGIDAEEDTLDRESLLGIDCGFNMGNILVSVVCLQFRPLGQGVEIRPGTEYQVGV